jgi:Fe2+ or Zn2+ uptake regulation protein
MLSADEIDPTFNRRRSINRVTVYRQLNLLENSLVERHSVDGRCRSGLRANLLS